MIIRSRPLLALYLVCLFALALGLTACGGADAGTPPTPNPNQDSENPGDTSSNVVGGRVENWTEQTATVRASIFISEPSDVSIAHFPESPSASLIEGPINADGTFSLTLPGADVMDQYLQPWGVQCDDVEGVAGSIQVTPSGLELSPLLQLDVYASGDSDPTGTLSYTVPSGMTRVNYSYSASAGTITGSCTFTYKDSNGAEVSNTDAYNVSLVAGWNELIVENTFPKEGGFTDANTYTGNVPSEAVWSYYEYSPPCDSSDPECEAPPPPPPPPAPPPTSGSVWSN